MNNFEQIRKHKNPLAKKGKLCLYDGKLKVMVHATPQANLRLATPDIFVHLQDDRLLISENDEYMKMIDGISQVETIRRLRNLVESMVNHMPLIVEHDSFGRQWRYDARLILDSTLIGIYVNKDDNNGTQDT